MKIRVLGICGSPIRNGNTEVFLKEALAAAAAAGDVVTSLIPLADKTIRDCNQCNWCVSKQVKGKYCAQADDMTPLYDKLLKSDVIFMATPVYFARLSVPLAAFIDRLRCLYMGKLYAGALVNKVGSALAVSWYRNRGIEPALQSIVSAYLGLQMIPVSPPKLGSPYGAAGNASLHGTGEIDREDKVTVLKDKHGLLGARTMAKRAVEVAQLVKHH